MPFDSAFTLKHSDFLCKFFVLLWATRAAVAVEPRGPPMTNVRTETAFRHDQCKHFQKSKPLLRSEVRWCGQNSKDLHLHRSMCLASRISKKKEPFPRSEFTPALYLDILDADRSPNAADSQRSSPGRLIPMVKLKRAVNKFRKSEKKTEHPRRSVRKMLLTVHARVPVWNMQMRSRLNLSNVRQWMWDGPLKNTPCVPS